MAHGLALFGSTAHVRVTSGSDVDVLVAFDGPATSKRYFGVQFYLEDRLGCRDDLVTEKVFSASSTRPVSRSTTTRPQRDSALRFANPSSSAAPSTL
ncbi:DNA polymerase subunit beta [Wenzhouxiangella sp. C33]|uniref:DNA polymerase subunit beta n=1 Tax=Wenzhouxiangella limi TaxID=2707351 RepID=A0A845VFT9_9GAMM|nr:DNA polymerase subunit beta [Wenzhouxiangella limi]